MPELPIATGFYEDASKPIASQECSNWRPQVPQTNAYTKAQLVGTPGISLFATAGLKPRRGERVMNEIPYVVTGNLFYRVNSDGTTTSLGTITGTGKVSIADNGTQLCIVVPGSTGYIYTVAGGLVTITDVDFTTTLGPSQQVVHKDGYFIHYNNTASVSTGIIFFISNLRDGLVYDPLDFGTAEVDPDKITGIHVSRNQLYVCGTETIEPFQSIPVSVTGLFPFQRVPGGVIPKGVKSRFSLQDFDNSFLFFGGGHNEKPTVWRIGASPQKISTAAIDKIISDHTDSEQDNVYITTYAEDGGFFANVHFKNRVLTYDAAASALMEKPIWFERRSKDTEGRQVIWRVAGIMKAYGVTLVTDNQSGKIGKLDIDTYTEYGVSIKRVVATQPFSSMGNPVSFSEMELSCESGTATAGLDPHITREYSDDGGYTFGNRTKRSLGKQGQYKIRQVWRREGQSRNTRVYRFVHDEPIKASIFKLEADIEA